MRFQIGKTWVGEGEPCFIVAELSCNHLGDLQRAREMIKTAAECGANAVKIQIDNPDGGITIDCDKDYFKIKSGPWKGKTFYELYKETYTPWEWVPVLRADAQLYDVELFATPSCIEGARYLRRQHMPAYKISSFEVTDWPLVREIEEYKKPIIFSDGCENYFRILSSTRWINIEVAILTCISNYPALPIEYNLHQIKNSPTIFGPDKAWSPIVGISDHSLGNEITLAAVALGAKIVERHFTLSRLDGGPDAGFSLQPDEFGAMVEQIRNIEAAMKPKSVHKSQKYCKSIFVVADIPKGAMLTEDNIGIIRPGDGLHPKHWNQVLGKRATKRLEYGEPLKEGDYE